MELTHQTSGLTMPSIFGDHMVLQQEATLPIWGWAGPGDIITIEIGPQRRCVTAGKSGSWRIEMKAFPPQSEPLTLTVKNGNGNELVFHDVLIGDVWLCSGQSNMELPLEAVHNAEEETAKAADSLLRFFHVSKTSSFAPQRELEGHWEICTPQSAGRFSAVACFFSRELRRFLHRPIGLIGAYWGGTTAQAWMPVAGLRKAPAFKNYLAQHRSCANRSKLGQPQSGDDAAASNHAVPSCLFNGMIAPLVPFAIFGVIWYQGESNSDRAIEYEALFPRLIESWREKWKQGDFPFLFVQLPNYGRRLPTPMDEDETWACLREAQSKALSAPNTGMAVTLDLGDMRNIHPENKRDVGIRLAKVALGVAYGRNIESSGPVFESMQKEGSRMRLFFRGAERGLVLGKPPYVAPGNPAPSTSEIKGFAICGADREWKWAHAEIQDNTIVVQSDEVPEPSSVRYGWANNPEINLYSKEGLPAHPFTSGTRQTIH